MLRKFILLFLSLGLSIFLAVPGRADFSSPSINLSNTPGTSSLYPKVASINGTDYAFVVWLENDGLLDALFFSKSTDGGSTWSAPYALTNWNGQIRDPYDGYFDTIQDFTFAICVDNPYVHVVLQWRADEADDFEIYYIRSDDLGDTWPIPNYYQLTNSGTDSHFPDVAARAGYVHIVYSDSWPGNDDIFYKRIPYGSGTADLTRRLTYSSGDSIVPKVAVSNSGMTVNVVYEDNVPGQNWHICFKHIAGYGGGSYETYQFTSGAYWNGLPDIVFSTSSTVPNDQYVYIVYNTFWPGNRDIMYKRIDSYGQTGFSTYTARLTYSGTESRSNSIDFDNINNTIHISYHDEWPGNYDVMYRKLLNFGGAGFTGQRVSWGAGDSSHSTIAASGNSAYVVWSDGSSGNYEIYLKKGF